LVVNGFGYGLWWSLKKEKQLSLRGFMLIILHYSWGQKKSTNDPKTQSVPHFNPLLLLQLHQP
jgi:hypothetical protein